LSTTFAHSPCGRHGCFPMTGGNPGPPVARQGGRCCDGCAPGTISCSVQCAVRSAQCRPGARWTRCDVRWVLCTHVSQPWATTQAQTVSAVAKSRHASLCFTSCADTAIILDHGVCVVVLRVTTSSLLVGVVCDRDGASRVELSVMLGSIICRRRGMMQCVVHRVAK
jgi:hypothetical protein